MLKKIALAISLGAAVVSMTGCMTPTLPKPGYQPEMSRAGNIARYFGINVEDTAAPSDAKLASDGSLMLDAAAWSNAFHSSTGPWTASSWTKAIGAGFAFSLLSDAFSPQDPRSRNWLIGYLPADQVQDTGDQKENLKKAREIYTNNGGKAIEKSMREMFPESEFKTIKVGVDGLWYYYVVDMQNPKLGCKFWDEKEDTPDDLRCAVALRASKNYWKVIQRPDIFGPSFPAYVFSGVKNDVKLYFIGGKNQNINWTAFTMAMAKNMPEHTYLYVAPKQAPNGTQDNPPFVVEKGRTNFFVKPTEMITSLQ